MSCLVPWLILGGIVWVLSAILFGLFFGAVARQNLSEESLPRAVDNDRKAA